MTNEYGSDSQPPQEHETEHVAGPETHAPDVESGVWPDDQPPHDDFGSAAEETPIVSQEAAAETETDDTSVAETRHSRSMLPVFAGIGGIILLGALIYWQFGRSSSSSTPPAFVAAMSAQKPEPVPTPIATPASPPTSAAATAASNATDINALYKPAAGTVPVAVPSPSVTAEAPTPTTAMASIPPALAPASPPPQAQAGQVINTPTAAPSIPAGRANWGGGDAAQIARLNALTTRIEDLQKAVDEENKQLSQVTNMVVAQAPPAAPNQANPELEGRLTRIEQTLMKLENDEAAKVSPPPPAPAVETPRFAANPYSNKSASTKTRHAHKKAKPVIHHKPILIKPPAETAEAKSSWILRAATPKEAWVSGDSTSPELRHVQVGDTLPGVGVVRAISLSARGWEIEGTTGVVR